MPIKRKRYSVSCNKRISENGFDLDLTYIKPNIIAMGFPYEKLEGIFKINGLRMDEVVRFLDLHHSNHYRVYNLCSERSYDSSKFHMRTISYPFDANCPPPFELIQQFCEDMSAFLKADDRNVAVVHCYDGVERVGVMICSYLLYDQIFYSTSDALQFFASTRTQDGVGIVIPSQRRYVQYYGYMIKNNITYSTCNTVYLQSLKFIGTPYMQGSCSPCFTVSVQKEKVYSSKVYDHIKRSVCKTEFLIPRQFPLWGDVTIKFFHQTRFGGKEDMFTFCFNACFVDMHLLLQQHQQGCTQTTPTVHKRSSCLTVDDDGSTTENNQMVNRAQSNSPLLTISSEPSEIRKFASLTDLHDDDSTIEINQMVNRAQSNSPLLTVSSEPSEIRKFASLTDLHDNGSTIEINQMVNRAQSNSPLLTVSSEPSEIRKFASLTDLHDDGSTTEINQMVNRAQSNSSLLTVPSQPSEIRKFASLTDLHTAASNTVPITYDQRSFSGSVLLSTNYQSSCKPRVQRVSSNFLYKKMLPQDKQLKRALKKAGKYAGIDITTGFTTVVPKPPKHDQIPRKIPRGYNPSLTLSPLAISRHRSTEITSNPTDPPVDALSVIVSSNGLSSDNRDLVTIVAPLSELDHVAKHIPDDFQLHIILSVDAEL